MTADRSVLIVGINYAPEPAGNAPYTTSLAEHLARTGWEVSVLTGVPHYPAWRREDASRDEMRNGVRVMRRRHFVPSTPDVGRRGLMEATWAVSGATTTLRLPKADVVLGVVPSLSGAAVALAASRRMRVPLVLWIQDLMGQAARQSGVSGGERVAGLVGGAELRLLGAADRIIVVGEGFASYLVERGLPEERITLARNWSLLPDAASSVDDTRRRFGLPVDASLVLHSGNMGSKQGLDVVVAAAERLSAVTFVLQGDGSQRAALEAQASGLDNVVFLPSLPGQDLADLLHAADVLLLTQRSSVLDMSVPSKLTSYLASGRPIVAGIHPDSEAARVLADASAGTLARSDDVDGLAAAIVATLDGGGSSGVVRGVEGGPEQLAAVLWDVVSGA